MRIQAPYRVTNRQVCEWQGSPAEIFPLLCPVREVEWVEGWDPTVVYSNSGIAENECVFVMPGEDRDDVWIVTDYEPNRRIAFIKFMATALSETGRERIDGYTEEWYAGFMREWTEAIDRHLARSR